MAGGLLTERALLTFKKETVAGQDANPTAAANALLVSEPDYSLDPNVLERNFVARDLSQFEHVIGRKLGQITFTTEIKSNGNAQSGLAADTPRFGELMELCGYEQVRMPGTLSFDSTADVTVGTDTITIANHGYKLNNFNLVTAGGTLPTGLVAQDYFVIVVDANNLKLATTLANAKAGTAVDITATAAGTGTLTSPNQIGAFPDANNGTGAGSKPDIGIGGAITVVSPVLYTLEVTTAGASGVAQYSLTGNNDAEDDLSTPQTGTITDDTAINLGTKGGKIVFDSSADFVLGDKWRVMVFSDGLRYRPISTGFPTTTLYLYRDGRLFKLTGAMGTFTIEAEAGTFASASFTFLGNFQTVTDVALPSDEVFEGTLPQQVELSLFTWGSNVSLIAESWTYDQANNVVPRPDVNNKDGFSGVRISDRVPAGTVNPEAELVANEDFWGDFAAARRKVFTARIGTAVGNQVVCCAPVVQVSEIGTGDRDGLETQELSWLAKRFNGDDEFHIAFT